MERLYTFSRAILLIDSSEPFPKQLVRTLAEIFQLQAVVLYERRSDAFYRAGPLEFEGLDDQLRDAALQGTFFADAKHNRVITAVRLGPEPIAGLALQGPPMPDSVLQGIANLVAIGLSGRARRIWRRRWKQPGKARNCGPRFWMRWRTSSRLRSLPSWRRPLRSCRTDQPRESRVELLRVADEEAKRLQEADRRRRRDGRLDSADTSRCGSRPSNVADSARRWSPRCGRKPMASLDLILTISDLDFDRPRLVKLAIKQLLITR